MAEVAIPRTLFADILRLGVSMTENSAFFGARRGIGPPDAGPQNGGGSSGLSKTPNRVRLG
jgi:hypothetical protein